MCIGGTGRGLFWGRNIIFKEFKLLIKEKKKREREKFKILKFWGLMSLPLPVEQIRFWRAEKKKKKTGQGQTDTIL